jgi:tetratricopeptide (TPR) repeat protein
MDEALASFRRVLQILPDHAGAQNNVGLILAQQGKSEEAIGLLQHLLRTKPDYADAHHNLGMAFQEQGRFGEAMTCYERALQRKPDFAEAHNNLGNVLREQGKLEEAAACYQRALALKPDYAEAHNNLGSIFQEQGRYEEAQASSRSALRLKPDFAPAHSNLGIVLQELNAFEDAERCFRQALVHDSSHTYAWYELANLLRGKLPEHDLAAMRSLLADHHLSDKNRARLHFGLAIVLDARKTYDESGAHLRRANKLALAEWQRRGEGYDPAAHAGFVDRLLAAFTPAFFERVRGMGVASERPIFVVGLPRSGTTLFQQILSSHSRVYGAGELSLAQEDFEMLAGDRFSEARAFEKLARLDAATVERLAKSHLEKLRALNAAAPRVVDKMPENFHYLGLLATLFPKAKFIHCRRDLRDVAVSCWMTNFRRILWASDPEHIAGCFRDYQRVMNHWRQVLPVPLLEVDYEETVTNLESVTRRLLAWCGLDWEPACLAFHQAKAPVRTASAIDVRQPIFTRSVARWKNYESSLGSLFAQLQLLQTQVR